MSYYVDGVAMDDPAERWYMHTNTLIPASAARDVAMLRLARRDGVVSKRLSWGTGTVRLALTVPPGAAVNARVRELQSLLSRAQVVRHVDDIDRSVDVVDVDVSDPIPVSYDFWRLQATLTVQPFWRAGSVLTSPTLIVPEPGTVTFTDWADTTGDLVDGVVRVRGPFSRREIRALDGTGVIIPESVTASQYVFIDVRSFTAWRGAASAWEPTATAIALDYPPAGPLRLYPTGPGVELHVDGGGFNADSSVALRAHRFYL